MSSGPDYSALSVLLSTAKRPTSPETVVLDALGLAVMARRLFPRGADTGLEPNETQILLALAVHPGQAANQLADRLLLARTTVSHALAQLQRRGLVDEQQDSEDRRVRWQRLTAQGQRLAATLISLLDTGLYSDR